MDRYREGRSPDRQRNRYPREPTASDSYIPSSGRAARPRSRSPAAYRRRSRTPPRWETDNWRGRPRSPPRRFDSRPENYARDDRQRSPRRDYPPQDAPYDDDARVVRPRSPSTLKRGREHSPQGTRRSPPPTKRERLTSPRRDYARPRSPRPQSPPRDGRARSRSPRRDDRLDPYATSTWRRRSPSPRAVRGERPGPGSGRVSAATSRRSSPRPRAPEPYPLETDPYDNGSRRIDSPPHDRGYAANGHGYDDREREAVPGEADYHSNGRGFGTPSGPGGAYRSSAMSPPSGPSSTPLSMSAHNRPGSSSGHPSSHSRGDYGGRGRGSVPREHSRDYPGPPLSRHGSYGAPSYGRGPSPRESSYPSRDAYPYDSRGPPRHRDQSGPSFNPSFRGSHNSTSTTYPRTQRFNQHQNDLPSAKPGGEARPELYDTTKADRLEEEAAKLRKLIDEKEAKKRQGLREWEKLEREASTAALKSELAEGHLRQLNGETTEDTQPAF